MGLLQSKINRITLAVNVILGIFLTITGFLMDWAMGAFTLLVSLMFSAAWLFMLRVRRNNISKLPQEIENMLYSDDFTVLDNNQEGELAVLSDEIRKMSIKLREGAYLLQKEKIYLMDSMADISHQLRTPLTSINIQISLLQKRGISEDEKMKYLRNITSHIQRIDWLISALLKISKIDAGTVHMKKDPVYISDVVGNAVEGILIPLEIKNQTFEFISRGDETIKGDLNWATEAISNIVKNCMEHTGENGKIKVVAEENPIYTKLVITDTGNGILPEDLPNIFQRFYRGKDSDDSSIGIGLALSKMIIQQQNGSIKAENNRDKGSRFTIKFYKGIEHGSIESRKSI